MKRLFISFLPTLFGLSLFAFKGERKEETSSIALQFILLALFSVLTISWVNRLVKHPLSKASFYALAVANTFAGLYIFYEIKDPFLSFPFFLLASYSLLRA